MSLLHRLSQILVDHFAFLWMLGFAGIMIVTIGMYWAGFVHGWQGLPERRIDRFTRRDILPIAAFVAYLAAYIAFMLWREDFAFEDNHNFTEYSAIGEPRPGSIWIDVGRFWPLGYHEYDLIAQFSRSAAVFLGLGALQLVIGLWMLYDSMPTRSPGLRLGALAVLMLAPAFGADFAELTYADRNVCFAICVLVFCISRYDRRPSLVWMIPAVVVGYSALYYKEITTALIGSFAASRILLKHYRHGWRNALRSPLEVGLVLGGACFAVQLALVILPTGTSRYVNEGSVGAVTALSRYLTADPLLGVFILCFAIHVFRTLRRGAKFDPLWDMLAVGGVMHILAGSVTGLEQDYLMGASELIAVVTLARLLPEWWVELPRMRLAIGALAGVLAVATMTFGAYRLLQRKAVVVQTQNLADYLIGYYQTPGNEKSRLYFHAEGGLSVNFLSYLAYRGLRSERTDETPGPRTLRAAGSEPYPRDLCTSYEVYVCRQDEMRPGDLVLRLAPEGEDHWKPDLPPTKLASGLSLQPMFKVEPANSVPVLRPILAVLHLVSPNMNGVYRGEPLPDDWASVSASKVVASAQ